MLASWLRRIALLIIAPFRSALVAAADGTLAAECNILREDNRALRHQCHLAEDKAARLQADIEHAVAWRDREIARLHAEADAYRAKSALVMESPDRE